MKDKFKNYSSYIMLLIIPLQLFFLLYKTTINFDVFFKFSLLNLYIYMFFKILEKRNINFGISLISVFCSLFFLSFLGFKFFSFIVLLSLIYFIKIIDKNKENFCFFIKKILILFVFSVPIIFFIISLQNSGYGSFFIDSMINSGTINLDELFHISISNMTKNYFKVSTGVNGLTFLKYHTFSHFIYGTVSRLLNIKTYYSYGFFMFITMTPLFFIGVSELSEQIVKSKALKNVIIKWVIIIFVYIGFSSQYSFSLSGITNSYIISESFLMGSVFFLGFISILIYKTNNVFCKELMLFLNLVILWVSKVSYGYVGSILMFLYFIFNRRKIQAKIKIYYLLLAYIKFQGKYSYSILELSRMIKTTIFDRIDLLDLMSLDSENYRKLRFDEKQQLLF